jgi:hypothetical protein
VCRAYVTSETYVQMAKLCVHRKRYLPPIKQRSATKVDRRTKFSKPAYVRLTSSSKTPGPNITKLKKAANIHQLQNKALKPLADPKYWMTQQRRPLANPSRWAMYWGQLAPMAIGRVDYLFILMVVRTFHDMSVVPSHMLCSYSYARMKEFLLRSTPVPFCRVRSDECGLRDEQIPVRPCTEAFQETIYVPTSIKISRPARPICGFAIRYLVSSLDEDARALSVEYLSTKRVRAGRRR